MMIKKIFHIITSLVVFFFTLNYVAQRSGRILSHKDTSEFSTQKDLEATYAFEALRWYNDQRAFPSGQIPPDWREKALAHISKNNLQKSAPSSSSLSWTNVGPNNIGGRIRSVVLNPLNRNTLYCGSVSGGIWKSTNAGASWFPTDDYAVNLVIGCMAIHPTDTNTIYAGTGEGYFNYDALRGVGVLKSTNGGRSWNLLNNFSGGPAGFPYFINDLYLRPDSTNILYAATNQGVFKTINGGTSWAYIKSGDNTNRATQIAAVSGSPRTFYVSFGNFSRDGIYKTTNGGTTWAKLTDGFPTSGYYRISMAISKSNPSIIFAVLSDSAIHYTHSVQKSTNGGTSWFSVATPIDPLINKSHLGSKSVGQGWYNNVIAVHPTNSSIVFAGGINLFKSTNGGTAWSMVTNWNTSSTYQYMHADQHAIVFDPANSSIMYFGNDGGMFKTTNAATTITEINTNLVTAQFYSGAVHPTAEIYYGGTQDNGTLKAGSPPFWEMVLGGDGGYTAVDYNIPTTLYSEYPYLAIQKSGNAGTSWSKMMSGIPTTGSNPEEGTSDRCAFIAPLAMNPSNPQELVAGTYRVFRTTNAAFQWVDITGSNDLTGDGAGSLGSTGAVISALAISKTAPTTIYVGTSGRGTTAQAKVWTTTNSGLTWSDRTGTLPNRYVKAITVDPLISGRAVLTFSGYGTGHVYLTTNRGISWANVSGDLPDIPVNGVLIDPKNTNHIIIGTDLGVFETRNIGTNWVQQNDGLANVAVADLDLRGDRYLFAATHGRGMFKSFETIKALASPLLLSPINNDIVFDTTVTLSWHSVENAISYELQVATDSNFVSGVIHSDTSLSDTFRVVDGLFKNNNYYWRVRGKNPEETSNYSEIWSFTVLPSLSIFIHQNPVLPRFIDFYLISQVALLDTPSMLISIAVKTDTIQLSEISTQVYRGSYEFSSSGTSTISAILTYSNGRDTTITRIFQVQLVKHGIAQTIQSPDEDAMMNLPPNLLTEDMYFTIIPDRSRDPKIPFGRTFTFGPGKEFSDRIVVSMRYSDDTVDEGKESFLCVYRQTATGWTPEESWIDKKQKIVSTRVTSLGTFALGFNDAGNSVVIPDEYVLHQNYPNPFNPSTIIRFELTNSRYVRIKVYNIAGQEIKTLLDEERKPGPNEVSWDGTDNFGNPLSSGVYFYQLVVMLENNQFFQSSQKMILIR